MNNQIVVSLLLAIGLGSPTPGCSKKVSEVDKRKEGLASPGPGAAAAVASAPRGPKDPEGCRKCKLRHDTECLSPAAVCAKVQGVAQAGSAKGTPRKQLCEQAYACIEKNDCTKWHPQHCYCGVEVEYEECLAGKGKGPCKKELEAALETTDLTELGTRYDKPEWAGGMAIDHGICMDFVCKGACKE